MLLQTWGRGETSRQVCPPLIKTNNGIRNHQQRNTRNETAYLGHQRPHKACTGNGTDAPPPIRGRTLSHRKRGMLKAFPLSPHFAGLSGQRHFPIHADCRKDTLPIVWPATNFEGELSEIKLLQGRLAFGSHTERTYRKKIPSNIAIARYFFLITRHPFAINWLHLRYRYKKCLP